MRLHITMCLSWRNRDIRRRVIHVTQYYRILQDITGYYRILQDIGAEERPDTHVNTASHKKTQVQNPQFCCACQILNSAMLCLSPRRTRNHRPHGTSRDTGLPKHVQHNHTHTQDNKLIHHLLATQQPAPPKGGPNALVKPN